MTVSHDTLFTSAYMTSLITMGGRKSLHFYNIFLCICMLCKKLILNSFERSMYYTIISMCVFLSFYKKKLLEETEMHYF